MAGIIPISAQVFLLVNKENHYFYKVLNFQLFLSKIFPLTV